MSFDPKNIPLGVFSLEAAEAIADAINDAGGVPAGADTQIQYNDAGAFGADANLTWDKTTGSFNAQSASALSSINLDGASENVTLTASGFVTFSSVGTASIFSDTELDLDSSSAVMIALQPSCKLGFFGVSAIAKPAVTGSKGGNAALASLITALANLGLITDSTT